MANTSPILNALENFDEASEAFDYILFLFQSENLFINDVSVPPDKRLCNIKELKEKITNEFESKESRDLGQSLESIYPVIELLEKKYLLKTFQDMLCISSGMLVDGEVSKQEFLNFVFKEFGFLDLEQFKKDSFITVKNITGEAPLNLSQQFLRSENELKYNYFEPGDSLNIKREKIINDLFRGDLERSKNILKQKNKTAGKQLFKHCLLDEIKGIEKNDELRKILFALLSSVKDTDFAPVDEGFKEQAENLMQKNDFLSLLSDGQKQFYKTLKVIKSRLENNAELELPEDDKNVLSFFLWLKSNSEKSVSILNALNEILERKSLCSDEKTNILYSSINMIQYEISEILGNEQESKNHISLEKLKKLVITENKFLIPIIERITDKVVNYCKSIYEVEVAFVKELKLQKIKNTLRKATKYSLIFMALMLFLFFSRTGFVYFFDISSIYENKYLPRAENILKSVPYPGELKDSLDPIRNEIKQRERLDYIKDLNSRYFEVLSLYLSPQLPESFIKDSIADVLISDDLKNKKSLLNARAILSKVISNEEWKNRYEPLIGVNVLTQLRAYGAVANFLLPSLSHHVIKDERGLSVKNGDLLQMYSPLPENEILKKDLLERFKKIPYLTAIYPSKFIDNYDDNYKNILVGTKLLQIKIKNVRLKAIWDYKKSKSKEQIEKLKDVLQAVAVVESRIKELRLKTKERHDYIVRHNTYRAWLE